MKTEGAGVTPHAGPMFFFSGVRPDIHVARIAAMPDKQALVA